MRFIAKKFYNKCKGKAPPANEILQPGACFCCGDKDHKRNECPLKDACLICGNSGLVFKNCNLVRNFNGNTKRILCIRDEEISYGFEEAYETDETKIDYLHDSQNFYEYDEKNEYQPAASISSVRLK